MKKALVACLIAIMVLIFTTTLGLVVIQISDFPYIVDINILNIRENSGLPREELIANYNAIMDYLSPFSDKEFALPTLNYTNTASIHFADVKALFYQFYILGTISAFILAIFVVFKPVSKRILKISGAFTLALPAAFAAAVAIDFDRSFNLFHKVFFNDSTWLFDPQTDEFINILPSTFFLHCGLVIMLFWLAAAVLQLIIGYSNVRVSKI